MERITIKIYKDDLELMRETKEKYRVDMGVQDFYSKVIRAGVQAITENVGVQEEVPTMEDAGVQETDRPKWLSTELAADPLWLREYCRTHTGAREEVLAWWSRNHTPGEVAEMDRIMITGG